MAKKLLFLCTGNSCRSQMAEGWCKALHKDSIEAYSAGIETHGLNANAIAVMKEVGIDLSEHCSQHVDEFKNVSFDYVITVCSHAHESCPVFSGQAKIIHAGFGDPPAMAKKIKEPERQLDCYRQVRDQIKEYIEKLPQALNFA